MAKVGSCNKISIFAEFAFITIGSLVCCHVRDPFSLCSSAVRSREKSVSCDWFDRSAERERERERNGE